MLLFSKTFKKYRQWQSRIEVPTWLKYFQIQNVRDTPASTERLNDSNVTWFRMYKAVFNSDYTIGTVDRSSFIERYSMRSCNDTPAKYLYLVLLAVVTAWWYPFFLMFHRSLYALCLGYHKMIARNNWLINLLRRDPKVFLAKIGLDALQEAGQPVYKREDITPVLMSLGLSADQAKHVASRMHPSVLATEIWLLARLSRAVMLDMHIYQYWKSMSNLGMRLAVANYIGSDVVLDAVGLWPFKLLDMVTKMTYVTRYILLDIKITGLIDTYNVSNLQEISVSDYKEYIKCPSSKSRGKMLRTLIQTRDMLTVSQSFLLGALTYGLRGEVLYVTVWVVIKRLQLTAPTILDFVTRGTKDALHIRAIRARTISGEQIDVRIMLISGSYIPPVNAVGLSYEQKALCEVSKLARSKSCQFSFGFLYPTCDIVGFTSDGVFGAYLSNFDRFTTDARISQRGDSTVLVRKVYANLFVLILYVIIILSTLTLSLKNSETLNSKNVDPTSLTSLVAVILALALQVYVSIVSYGGNLSTFLRLYIEKATLDEATALKLGLNAVTLCDTVINGDDELLYTLSTSGACYLDGRSQGNIKVEMQIRTPHLEMVGIVYVMTSDGRKFAAKLRPQVSGLKDVYRGSEIEWIRPIKETGFISYHMYNAEKPSRQLYRRTMIDNMRLV